MSDRRSKRYSEKVIQAFLKNSRVKDIAADAGIGVATVRTYRQDPELQRILRERKREMVTAAIDTMRSFLCEGAEILIKLIRDPDTPPQTRVNALNLLFSQLRDWSINLELEERVAVLEIAENIQISAKQAILDGETC